MPNWIETHIRLNGKTEDVKAVEKSIVITDEYIERCNNVKFNLCEHVKKSPCLDKEAEKTCKGCGHDGHCPLLSTDTTHVERQRRAGDYGRGKVDELNKGKVSFDILLPQPDNIYLGGTNKQIKELNDRYGIVDWYEWNIANWGTKWNAQPDQSYVEWFDDNTLLITIHTAWETPKPWLERLAAECKKHNVVMDGEFADEDFGGTMGEFHTNDDEDDDFTINYDSMNAELFTSVWGWNPPEVADYNGDEI